MGAQNHLEDKDSQLGEISQQGLSELKSLHTWQPDVNRKKDLTSHLSSAATHAS